MSKYRYLIFLVLSVMLFAGVNMSTGRLLPWKTVRENIQIVRETAAREDIDKMVAEVGLTGFEDYYPHQLSGGMKQRCAIARTFNYGGDLILMDEPFASLDVRTRANLQENLLALWQKTGVTILFVTHDLEEAALLASRIAVLDPRVGKLTQIIANSLPRPRQAGDPQIRKLAASIGRFLK
jgi:NitT/TauT family transport system ATP-binding protein